MRFTNKFKIPAFIVTAVLSIFLFNLGRDRILIEYKVTNNNNLYDNYLLGYLALDFSCVREELKGGSSVQDYFLAEVSIVNRGNIIYKSIDHLRSDSIEISLNRGFLHFVLLDQRNDLRMIYEGKDSTNSSIRFDIPSLDPGEEVTLLIKYQSKVKSVLLIAARHYQGSWVKREDSYNYFFSKPTLVFLNALLVGFLLAYVYPLHQAWNHIDKKAKAIMIIWMLFLLFTIFKFTRELTFILSG